jgi:hypothetical protein
VMYIFGCKTFSGSSATKAQSMWVEYFNSWHEHLHL